MSKTERTPDFSLFLDILRTLEAIQAPYMIIGAFAATIYGITRTTYDIDIVVDLSEEHIRALEAAYPLPRYYADAEQMRSSIRMGIMFNVIDITHGQKADLVPLSMDERNQRAFQNRVRKRIDISEDKQLEIWCARPEDVILGKLTAWSEGRSRRHETDIYDMMIVHYLSSAPTTNTSINEPYIDNQVQTLGEETVNLWQAIKKAAQEEANRT
ncbi:MAG: nucleotidyl transferase AbiEii/AbiGii toxin family protein [Ardenticatenaceae bacterium]